MKENRTFLVLAFFTILILHCRFSMAQTERADINGTVTYNGTAVCAMVLANGQYMFSCGEDLGTFDLEVPLNENGEIVSWHHHDPCPCWQPGDGDHL